GIRSFHVTGVQTCALPISFCALITLFPVLGFAQSTDLIDLQAIVRSKKGAPIVGATVRAESGEQVLTDSIGSFTISTRLYSDLVDRKSTRLNSSHVKISYA